MLKSIRHSNLNLVSSVSIPNNPNEPPYDDVIKLLQERLEPKKDILVSQHWFLSIYQTNQQSISEFVHSKLLFYLMWFYLLWFYARSKTSIAYIFSGLSSQGESIHTLRKSRPWGRLLKLNESLQEYTPMTGALPLSSFLKRTVECGSLLTTRYEWTKDWRTPTTQSRNQRSIKQSKELQILWIYNPIVFVQGLSINISWQTIQRSSDYNTHREHTCNQYFGPSI